MVQARSKIPRKRVWERDLKMRVAWRQSSVRCCCCGSPLFTLNTSSCLAVARVSLWEFNFILFARRRKTPLGRDRERLWIWKCALCAAAAAKRENFIFVYWERALYRIRMSAQSSDYKQQTMRGLCVSPARPLSPRDGHFKETRALRRAQNTLFPYLRARRAAVWERERQSVSLSASPLTKIIILIL